MDTPTSTSYERSEREFPLVDRLSNAVATRIWEMASLQFELYLALARISSTVATLQFVLPIALKTGNCNHKLTDTKNKKHERNSTKYMRSLKKNKAEDMIAMKHFSKLEWSQM
jgi:hypothetical protein